MFVNMCVKMCVHIYVKLCVNMCVLPCVYTWVNMCVHMWVNMCINMLGGNIGIYVCKHMCKDLSKHMFKHVCKHVSKHVCKSFTIYDINHIRAGEHRENNKPAVYGEVLVLPNNFFILSNQYCQCKHCSSLELQYLFYSSLKKWNVMWLCSPLWTR